MQTIQPADSVVKVQNSRKLDSEILFAQLIGILAVINGHFNVIYTTMGSFFTAYSWHMPFFVFISGILFGRTYKKRTCLKYLLHKCRTLLIPALFVNLCYGIINYFMRQYHFVNYGREINFTNLFITPFGPNYQFPISVSLWFIFQLFVIEVIANFIYRIPIRRKEWIFDLVWTILCFAASIFVVQKSMESQALANKHLTINRTGFLMLFFVLGIDYEKYLKDKLQKLKNPIFGCLAAVLIQCTVLILLNTSSYSFNTRSLKFTSLPTPFLPFFTFLTASCFILCLARYLAPQLEKSKLLPFIGPNIRYIVYHHQFTALFMGLVSMIFVVHKWINFNFSLSSFKNNNYYMFAWSPNLIGRTPYLIIPFIVPVLIGSFINRWKRPWVRILLWCLLELFVIGFIVFFGTRYRNILVTEP